MEIIVTIGILAAALVATLAYRLPKAQKLLAAIMAELPPPRHAQDPADTRTPLQRWNDGPPPAAAAVVGIDTCPYCSRSPILQNGGPHCPRCGWARPADRSPWTVMTAADLTAAYLNAKLDRARAIAAEPRPRPVLLGAPTADISGAGTAAPEPPQAPVGPCPQTDGSMVVPGAWRARLDRALGALADAGELVKGGPGRVAHDPAPPADDAGDAEDRSWTAGAMRWRPTAMASAADQVRALCAAQDAAALLIREAIAMDAAAYLASLRRQLAGGPA